MSNLIIQPSQSQFKQEDTDDFPISSSTSRSTNTDKPQTQEQTDTGKSSAAIVSPDRESIVSQPSSVSSSVTKSTPAMNKTETEDQQSNTTTEADSTNSVEDTADAVIPKSKKNTEYADWPLNDIKEPHNNDVLYGRGGGTNHHPGNKRYRKLVEGRKVDYVNSKRLDKPLVALEIIKEWRAQVPPGRFLKIDEETGLWHDVGDKKAREKTSQALREKAPLLRKQQEEQRREKAAESGGRDNEVFYQKNTRFTVPETSNSKVSKNLNRVLLARDHSLGRDYFAPDEPVSVKGFSWNTPITSVPEDISRTGSWDQQQLHPHPHQHHLNTSPAASTSSPSAAYAIRGSGTSDYMARQHQQHHHISPHRHHHHTQHPITTMPASFRGSGNTQHSIQPYDISGEYIPSTTQSGVAGVDSEWSTATASTQHHMSPNPRTPRGSDTMHATPGWRGFHSEDMASRKVYANPQQNNYRISRSAEDPYRRSREADFFHPGIGSDGVNSVTTNEAYFQSDDYARIANIVGSGQDSSYVESWRQRDDRRVKNPEAYYDVSPYHSPDRMTNDPYGHRSNNWTSPHAHPQSCAQNSMDYYRMHNNSNDAYLSEGTTPERSSSRDQDSFDHGNIAGYSSPTTREDIPRPPNVKRDTSHKLQTIDVEPTTKRMNRQSSIGYNKPSYNPSSEGVTDQDIKRLNSSLQQSTLEGGVAGPALNKPLSLKESDRMTTIEQFDRLIGDIEGSSSPLDEGSSAQSRISNISDINSPMSSIRLNDIVGRPRGISDNDRNSTIGTIDSEFMNELGCTNTTSV